MYIKQNHSIAFGCPCHFFVRLSTIIRIILSRLNVKICSNLDLDCSLMILPTVVIVVVVVDEVVAVVAVVVLVLVVVEEVVPERQE